MKLKDIGKIVTGKTPSTKQLENFSELDDKYLFVTPRDMKDNCKYIESTERYLTSFVEDKFKSQIIKKDSVCISCIGSDMGKVYMMITFSILPVIVVYLTLSKHIVGGVAMGSVKG